MPKLVSMKLSKTEAKAMTEPSMSEKDRPRYPWGLTLTLDTDSLDKLGIDDLPEVGESYMLVAKCDVTSCSSNMSEGGSSRSISLQLTDLALADGDDTKGKAGTLYDSGGDD